ncbi:hypothetical protein ACOME3_010271 [Neoechinorhynchus agilis]
MSQQNQINRLPYQNCSSPAPLISGSRVIVPVLTPPMDITGRSRGLSLCSSPQSDRIKWFNQRSSFQDYDLLAIDPSDRNDVIINRISVFLCDLCKSFRSLSKHALNLVSSSVRLQRLPLGDWIYGIGDVTNCWYVLLHGSILIDDGLNKREVYSERGQVFGRRRKDGKTALRDSSCLVLEDNTQFLVIDYLDADKTETSIAPIGENNPLSPQLRYHESGGSLSTTTTGTSISEVSESLLECRAWVSLQKEPSDRTEYDIGRIVSFMGAFNAFDDISQSCLTVKRELARVLVLAVVDHSDTVIMSDGEEYDAWSVIISGKVENRISLKVDEAHGCRSADRYSHSIVVMGVNDSFGLCDGDGESNEYHRGVMKTLIDNCRFLCVPKDDYLTLARRYGLWRDDKSRFQKIRSLSASATDKKDQRRTRAFNTLIRPKDTVEEISSLNAGEYEEDNVILGSQTKLVSGNRKDLLDYLVKASYYFDFAYVNQYLLTHRAFKQCSIEVCDSLIQTFNKDIIYREPVVNVFLHWIAKYGADFEWSTVLSSKLDEFIDLVHRNNMFASLRLLAIACSTANSSSRSIVIPRNNRDELLQFDINESATEAHRYHKGLSVFVMKVEKDSKAAQLGLKRGDEILEINGQPVAQLKASVSEVMRQTTHLSLTVRYNLIGYYELISFSNNHDSMLVQQKRNKTTSIDHSQSSHGYKSNIVGVLAKRLVGVRSTGNASRYHQGETHSSSSLVRRSQKSLWKWKRYRPVSPDRQRPEQFEFVIKVFISEENFRLLRINKFTTAREAASSVLCNSDSAIGHDFTNIQQHQVALYELSHDNLTYWKQRRLPDQVRNLAYRLPYRSRYYVKSTSIATSNCSTNNARQSVVDGATVSGSNNDLNILSVDIYELASQLSLRAYVLFSNVKSQEYINHIFKWSIGKQKHPYESSNRDLLESPNLDILSNMINREMYWVVSEVVKQSNVNRRVLVIKKFIKLAEICKELKNFNSLLTIISGLGHKSVCRLHRTWARVPDKSKKTYANLQSLLDPSRNMLKYRSLFRSPNICSPIIPMFPICIKDLVYIHQANSCTITNDSISKEEHVVNFEKFTNHVSCG